MGSVTLEEGLELFKLPRVIGDYEGKTVTVSTGRYGPYILHDKKYTSLPKEADPMTITLSEAVALIEGKRKQEAQKHLKIFLEDDKLEILNGRYGPYLVYDGKNYRLPKNLHEKAAELKYEECMAVINKSK
jgi:DNA topoisomerase-1